MRTRQGEASCRELDDEFAQLASEFDTLDELRADLRERLARVKKVEQLYAARDKALEAARRGRRRAGAGGRRRATRSSSRKQAMVDQLERIGASLEEYLAAEEQDRGGDRRRADRGGRPRASGSSCCWTPSPTPRRSQVSDDEFGHEIVHRAQRAGMPPQQYYDQLVRSGAAGAVFGDVRRGKALAAVMERVTIKDTDGNVLSLDDLREADEHAGHDHELTTRAATTDVPARRPAEHRGRVAAPCAGADSARQGLAARRTG